MKALLFGSIGTLADTSALQLTGFNAAFEASGLDWRWDLEDYRKLLAQPGGKMRVQRYAESVACNKVDEAMVDEIHRFKTEHFNTAIRQGEAKLRPGVVRLVQEARAGHLRLGLISTTERATIDSIIHLADGTLSPNDFDVIVDRSLVASPKPDPEAYRLALDTLGADPSRTVAIEDTPACVDAVVAAGINCIATPNEVHRNADFSKAHSVVDCLGDTSCDARLVAGVPIISKGFVTLERLTALVHSQLIKSA